MARIQLHNSPAHLLPVLIVLADYAPSASLLDLWQIAKKYEDQHDDCVVGSFKGDLYGLLREIDSNLAGTSLAEALPKLLGFSYAAYGDGDLGLLFEIDDYQEELAELDDDERQHLANLVRLRETFSDINSLTRAEIEKLMCDWYSSDFLAEIRELKDDIVRLDT